MCTQMHYIAIHTVHFMHEADSPTTYKMSPSCGTPLNVRLATKQKNCYAHSTCWNTEHWALRCQRSNETHIKASSTRHELRRNLRAIRPADMLRNLYRNKIHCHNNNNIMINNRHPRPRPILFKQRHATK